MPLERGRHESARLVADHRDVAEYRGLIDEPIRSVDPRRAALESCSIRGHTSHAALRSALSAPAVPGRRLPLHCAGDAHPLQPASRAQPHHPTAVDFRIVLVDRSLQHLEPSSSSSFEEPHQVAGALLVERLGQGAHRRPPRCACALGQQPLALLVVAPVQGLDRTQAHHVVCFGRDATRRRPLSVIA